ncbi:MAG: LuxR C-terminal-related transcriptional regulator, partial [Acidimicrobiia bacterium]
EMPPTEIPPGLDDDGLTEFLSATSQGMAYSERRFTDAIDFLADGMSAVHESRNRDRLALELMVLSGLVSDVDALLGAAKAVSANADPNTRLLGLSATQLAEALTLTTASSWETQDAARDVLSNAEVADHLREQMAMARVMVTLAEGRLAEARSSIREYPDKTLAGSWLTIEAVLAEAWLTIAGAEDVASAAVAALQQFDPLANLAQARIVLDLRRAQRGGPVGPGESSDHEPGVAVIDQIMNRRVEAWLAWAQGDPTAGKQMAEVGREAIGMGHRFWGLLALIDAVRLGLGDDVALDIDHLVLTRGAGLAVLAGRHARAGTADELWNVARSWWDAGAPVFALEAAMRGGTVAGPIPSLGAHLMAAAGVEPLVGDLGDLPCPISARQLQIVGRVLGGDSNEDVAERLFLSRRTVENHLHRIYGVLGLSDGRDELKSLFGWIVAPSTHDPGDALPSAGASE